MIDRYGAGVVYPHCGPNEFALERLGAELYSVDIAVNDCFREPAEGEVTVGYFSLFDMAGNRLSVGSEDRSTSPHTWIFPKEVRFRIVP